MQAHNEDIFFPVAERGLYLPKRNGSFQPTGYKAIVRMGEIDEDKLVTLAVVKDSYKTIKHKDVYDAILPLVHDHSHTIDTYFDKQGQSAYIDIRFNDIQARVGRSQHNFRAIFRNGYGDSAFSMIAGAINMFCTNGMIVGEYERAWRRHTDSLDVGVAHEWLSQGIKAFDNLSEHMMNWHDTAAKQEHWDFALPKMIEHEDHIHKLKEVAALKYVPEYDNTLLALYNTMTDYATYYKDYRKRNVTSITEHMQRFRLLARANTVMEQLPVVA